MLKLLHPVAEPAFVGAKENTFRIPFMHEGAIFTEFEAFSKRRQVTCPFGLIVRVAIMELKAFGRGAQSVAIVGAYKMQIVHYVEVLLYEL